MSFKVTEEMAEELFQHPGRIIYGDRKARLELLQGFIDQHNLVPASAVEEVELTNMQALALLAHIRAAKCGREGKVASEAIRSLGFRIVRDVNTVAADDTAKHDAMDAVIEKLTSRINALEINQGDAKKMNAELMKRVDKVGTDCQSLKAEVTRAENRAIQIKNRVEALEASETEAETKPAKRTFTEENIRAAIDYANQHSVAAELFVELLWKRLGIDLEANKQTEHDDD